MTLRVGLLGCGGIGARHAGAIQAVDGLDLVACCGRDAQRTADFAAKFGGTAYTDFARMLDEARLDLLVVALPPYAHAGEVELAAARGVNLLVEKPIALTLDRAESMVAATQGVVAACGFMYRFGAGVERWNALSAAAATGAVGHFSGSFHSNALHAPWWRARDKSGGQMVEQLIHIVDLARQNLGMPQAVYARAGNVFHRGVPGYTAEDVSALVLGYDDGRVGVLHASNGAVPGRWMKGWQIVAARATGMFADWNHAEIVHTGGEVQSETIAGTTDPFAAQLADLRDAIAGRRAPRVPLADGLATLRIVLAAQRSAETHAEIVP
ncbi:MAG TPA: Gfo/Idh/MocA family oxidoreductase [Devosia sp.]|nr:Gfo/Idh/MocA family oxidoreductase [Devosia sp.]